MKKLVIREVQGRYHLENFGPGITGPDGRAFFSLVIESQSRGLYLEFPEASLFDLFTRFDLKDPDFLSNRYACPDFVRVTDQSGECAVEALSGTLYDFFRERIAAGHCQVQVAKPVAFYWRSSERDVA